MGGRHFIGGINAAIIAGNPVPERLPRLQAFWERIESRPPWSDTPWGKLVGHAAAYWNTILGGIPNDFAPNSAVAFGGLNALVGVEHAAFYTTEGLRRTVAELVDFERLKGTKPRLTVGAVNVRTGKMHYFDSRSLAITLDHVLASTAVPPGFPAVRIDGDPYWDGGLYSNTPVEVVFDDNPRHDRWCSRCRYFRSPGRSRNRFSQVLSRQKDIAFASRADSHIRARSTSISSATWCANWCG